MNRVEPIALLTTLDKNYLPQLQVLLTSIHLNNPGEIFSLYLLHKDIPRENLEQVKAQCSWYGYTFTPVTVEEALFKGAPVTKQYPKEMYYRLLAPHLLPETLKKVIYLDPDILVINPLRPLWEIDLKEKLFAAAAHTGKAQLADGVNQLRLGTQGQYYNSGVLLLNLRAGREKIDPQTIFQYVKEHGRELLLPDQDVLNALYENQILSLDDVIWNYDARNYRSYFLFSGGVYDLPWVMEHTVVIHFCGKDKPWKKGYSRRFGVLYQHYLQLTRRELSFVENELSLE